jgi:hypothetical protein
MTVTSHHPTLQGVDRRLCPAPPGPGSSSAPFGPVGFTATHCAPLRGTLEFLHFSGWMPRVVTSGHMYPLLYAQTTHRPAGHWNERYIFVLVGRYVQTTRIEAVISRRVVATQPGGNPFCASSTTTRISLSSSNAIAVGAGPCACPVDLRIVTRVPPVLRCRRGRVADQAWPRAGTEARPYVCGRCPSTPKGRARGPPTDPKCFPNRFPTERGWWRCIPESFAVHRHRE